VNPWTTEEIHEVPVRCDEGGATMADRVGIVAVAQTRYEPGKPEVSSTEMVYELVEQLLDETGLTHLCRRRVGH
jgi:DNA-directed RNA polymerase subunit N (RpoN/RPB10)